MGGRSNIEQVFFLSIFPVSVILIGYRHLRAIKPHTKIHLIKEALLSCIIGHCMRKGKTDNSNLKTTTKTTETIEISIRMRKQFKLSIVLYK